MNRSRQHLAAKKYHGDPIVATDGLAISYEYLQPIFSQLSTHVEELALEVSDADEKLPSPANPVNQDESNEDLDEPEGRTMRYDSLFDLYAEPDAEDDDEQQEEHDEVQASYGLSNPWDTRNSSDLYGGGGRGANDRETGWIGRQASDTSGHFLPPAKTFIRELPESTSRPTAPKRLPAGSRPSITADGRTGDAPMPTSLSNAARPTRLSGKSDAASKDPHSPSRIIPRLAKVRSIKTKRIASDGPRQSPSATSFGPQRPGYHEKGAPAPASTAAWNSRSQPPYTGQSADTATAVRPVLSSRSSSLAERVGLSRSKRPLVISKPILPAGFVESLGMETFDLASDGTTPANFRPNILLSSTGSDTNSRKQSVSIGQAPIPRSASVSVTRGKNAPVFPVRIKASAQPASTPSSAGKPASPPVNSRQVPEIVMTPLDALRNLRKDYQSSGTSSSSSLSSIEREPHRATVVEAYRRLSEDSVYSESAPLPFKAAEEERRVFFNQLRSGRIAANPRESTNPSTAGAANKAAVPHSWSRSNSSQATIRERNSESSRGRVVASSARTPQRDSDMSSYSDIDDDEMWDEISPLETARTGAMQGRRISSSPPTVRKRPHNVPPVTPTRTTSRVNDINEHRRPSSRNGNREQHLTDSNVVSSVGPLDRLSWHKGGPRDTTAAPPPKYEPIAAKAASTITNTIGASLFRNPFEAPFQVSLVR